ncbi:MAG: hypothetical protein II206_11525, partial [Bacteroidaceae bacterium]|nr:hypothetical protein [Bacteroidaceae bacterium]
MCVGNLTVPDGILDHLLQLADDLAGLYAEGNALKPLDELFKYPPRMIALNPTFDNFFDLFVTMGKSWVSFTR